MPRWRRAALRCGVALLAALCAVPAAAQRSAMARADTLLRAGRLRAADSLYWYGWRRAPRDPAVRFALGRYLAARGALKVGAVLMEEALFFGGDTARVGAELAPLYERLGTFGAVAALPPTAVDSARRARARWLERHAPSTAGADSAFVPYAPAASEDELGSILLVLGRDTVRAAIVPAAIGLVLDTTLAEHARVRVFGEGDPSGTWPAVASAVRLGAVTLRNVPAMVVRGAPTTDGAPWHAAVGLDFLARLAPTFHAELGEVMLRRRGHLPRDLPGTRTPYVLLPDAAWIAHRGALLPLGSTAAAAVLSSTWTLDERHGVVIVGAP
ncbi:MAG TPA: hypothetical protein VFK13_12200 [Gemmatimonadaceae bacterium]|nr:hypothetical protein [Gemmatimonadaceae bacterium]